MISTHISNGISKANQRRSLILLLYLVGFAIAALLAVPIFRIVSAHFGRSGFSPELAERMDFFLWLDMMQKGGAAGLGAAMRQFVWAVPLYMIWKVASQVGLVHALQGDATSSFWEGLGRFTLRGLLIALVYFVVSGLLIGILWVVVGAIANGQGEVGSFWLMWFIGPLLTVVIIATFDVMHDYARMHLVLRDAGIWRSILSGSIWPLRRISALFLYDLWFVLAAVLWLLPFWLDYTTAKTTIAGMLVTFLLQQVAVLLRNAVTVSWLGSEVSYFEANDEPMEIPSHQSEGEGDDESEGEEDATSAA